MSEMDVEWAEEEEVSVWQFRWLIDVLVKPRKVFERVAELKKNVWLLPLLVLMVSAVVVVLLSIPYARQSAPQMELPMDYEYYPNDYKENYQEVMAVNTSAGKIIIVPLLGRFAGIWLGWLLLGVLLHLSLTLNGSRSSNQSALNVVAWAMTPLALRNLVQIGYMLFAGAVVAGSGLSGFAPQDAAGFSLYASGILGLIDLYFIWQVFLTVLGARLISDFKPLKAWLAVLIALAVFVALRALPPYVSSQLSGIFSNGMF
ncbi:MAG: YIP1 family protein [Anaerolineaceae bacterium]|nr:YIP1 family protein [Anaerolineaceae bacterium]